jgi:hypothetical protein
MVSDPHCVHKTGEAITAMTLAKVAKEVIESDENSNIVLSYNTAAGPKGRSRWFHCSGNYRSLSTDTKSRDNLTNLKLY